MREIDVEGTIKRECHWIGIKGLVGLRAIIRRECVRETTYQFVHIANALYTAERVAVPVKLYYENDKGALKEVRTHPVE